MRFLFIFCVMGWCFIFIFLCRNVRGRRIEQFLQANCLWHSVVGFGIKDAFVTCLQNKKKNSTNNRNITTNFTFFLARKKTEELRYCCLEDEPIARCFSPRWYNIYKKNLVFIRCFLISRSYRFICAFYHLAYYLVFCVLWRRGERYCRGLYSCSASFFFFTSWSS